MNSHCRAGTGFIQQFLLRFRFVRRNIETSGAFDIIRSETARSRSHTRRKSRVTPALVFSLSGIVLIYFVTQASMRTDASASDENQTAALSDESMLINPGARVSVSRTSKTVVARVFTGTVLFRTLYPHRPIVVTAGYAQVNDVNAAICVSVQGDRASVIVIHGSVELSTLGLDENTGAGDQSRTGSRIIKEVILHTGEQAEVTKNGSDITLRLESSRRSPSECSFT